jgi:hypothetical protein
MIGISDRVHRPATSKIKSCWPPAAYTFLWAAGGREGGPVTWGAMTSRTTLLVCDDLIKVVNPGSSQ